MRFRQHNFLEYLIVLFPSEDRTLQLQHYAACGKVRFLLSLSTTCLSSPYFSHLNLAILVQLVQLYVYNEKKKKTRSKSEQKLEIAK